MSLEDIFFFTGFNNKASIYLPENDIVDVQKYLDSVLKKQNIKQKEIREKKKRMRSREGECIDASDLTRNIEKEDIKLQLVAI